MIWVADHAHNFVSEENNEFLEHHISSMKNAQTHALATRVLAATGLLQLQLKYAMINKIKAVALLALPTRLLQSNASAPSYPSAREA